jgi:hypothetical protein
LATIKELSQSELSQYTTISVSKSGIRPPCATVDAVGVQVDRAWQVRQAKDIGDSASTVGGVLPPAGATIFEHMQMLRADDSLRRLLLREPRGVCLERVATARPRV